LTTMTFAPACNASDLEAQQGLPCTNTYCVKARRMKRIGLVTIH
jgi:hypothetical protein